MVVVTETEALDQLREHMIGQRSGVVSVIDVEYEYLINEYAEEYLLVALILSDPPADRRTWPIPDVSALERRGRAEARRLRIAPPFFVATSSRPEPGEWDDGDGGTEAKA